MPATNTDTDRIQQQLQHSPHTAAPSVNTSSQPVLSKDLRHRFRTAGEDRKIISSTSCNVVMAPPMTNNSTMGIYGYLSSQGSSSSPSVLGSISCGGYDRMNRNRRTVQRSIQRYSSVSDLQQRQSTPEPSRYRASPELPSQPADKLITRRLRSVKPLVEGATRFSSPDRYTPRRPSPHTTISPFRTSYHPHLLDNYERMNRCRGNNSTVFRSVSEGRVNQAITRPSPDSTRSFQPPHYTPSFANSRYRRRVHGAVRPDPEFFRRTSAGSVWRLSGWHAPPVQMHGVDLGNGTTVASGSNAPMVDGTFLNSTSPQEHNKKHEQRLALALNIDPAQRILPSDLFKHQAPKTRGNIRSQYQWFNGGWTRDYTYNGTANNKSSILRPEKVVPAIAFRVLDAPRLKDDYYCSVLVYCHIYRTLAVALAHRVYLWTEKHGVRYPPLAPVHSSDHVTCLAFSSDEGTKAILATARQSGNVVLWSLLERKARFDIPHPSTACTVAFRPTITKRYSLYLDSMSDCEDLLVGDDAGRIYYYSVEWPENKAGSVLLLVKLNAHSQNVCGLTWAPHGRAFVSGGNDNSAMLFDVDDVFDVQYLLEDGDRVSTKANTSVPTMRASNTFHTDPLNANFSSRLEYRRRRFAVRNMASTLPSALQSTPNLSSVSNDGLNQSQMMGQRAPPTPPLSPATTSFVPDNDPMDPNTAGIANAHKFVFYHSAAVKAIAFAPWQPSLLATSGGSNDRQIHFHHTETGTTLAVINVFAQVTSLIWSHTRREIAATFGYAQPDHEVRIAVFAWPSCECVVSIPWERKGNGDIGRALWAIPYPGGPNDASPERLQNEDGVNDARRAQRPRNLHASSTEARYHRDQMPPSPVSSPERQNASRERVRTRHPARGEGETWASRTEEEGSLIVACCDQTIKFFEVWAGKSKGKSRGLGSKTGVLGGSKVLEGWCEGVAIDEIGQGEHVIR